MLELKDYVITYDNYKKIEYGDIYINEHEFVGISGKSGCGKTSLLNSIFGMNFKGKVSYTKAELYNKDLFSIGKEKYKYISYSPQFSQDALNPKLRVSEHIYLTLKSNGIQYDESQINNIFDELSLDNKLLKYYPYMLSGGQKQRIIIALSTLKRPKMLIFDESSSAIDLITLKTIYSFIHNIRKSTAIVLVSHNHDFLDKLCDRVITLKEQ